MTDSRSHDLDPRLRDAVDALPEEVPPARDLWPAIHAELESDRHREFPAAGAAPTQRPAARRSITLGIRGIAAAAAAVVLVTATVTWQLSVRAPSSEQSSTEGAGVASPSEFSSVSFASYESAADELSALLEQRAARLDPATLEVLDRTLRTIDEALAEARAALENDPESASARGFVESIWRQKVEFLRRANDVAILRQG